MKALDIITRVAILRGLKPADLQRHERGMEAPGGKRARCEAMALVRSECDFSYEHIGRIFGGFHHTTVLYSIRQAHRRGTLPDLRKSFEPDTTFNYDLDPLLKVLRDRRRKLRAEYDRDLAAIDSEIEAVARTARVMRAQLSILLDDPQIERADAA